MTSGSPVIRPASEPTPEDHLLQPSLSVLIAPRRVSRRFGANVTGANHGTIRTLAVYIDMTFQRRVVMLSRSRRFGRCPEGRLADCVFGTSQASIALLVLLLLVHPSQAFAANPDLETVLTGSRRRIEELDYRFTGRITTGGDNAQRTS